jgi:hypothetical protein
MATPAFHSLLFHRYPFWLGTASLYLSCNEATRINSATQMLMGRQTHPMEILPPGVEPSGVLCVT